MSDELADRRRTKSEVRSFVDHLNGALRDALIGAYDPQGPENQRYQTYCAHYDRESERWWADLKLLYVEQGRWADDGGREP